MKLVNNSANKILKDNKGNTPLHVAASRGHFQLVKMLTDDNADIDVM